MALRWPYRSKDADEPPSWLKYPSRGNFKCPWDTEPQRLLWNMKYNSEEELFNDAVKHERPDRDSREEIIRYVLVTRWTTLFDDEIFRDTYIFLERTKASGLHWAAWVPSNLATFSPKKLAPSTHICPFRKPRPPPTWEEQPGCALLGRLPTEVRLLIFEYALTPHDAKSPYPGRTVRGLLVGTPEARQPPLLFMSRQIRHEALPLFYGANTFTFQIDSRPALLKVFAWIDALGDYNPNHLQNIVLIGFGLQDLTQYLAPGTPGWIAQRVGQQRALAPIRIGINLRNWTFTLQTGLCDVQQRQQRWQTVMDDMKIAADGRMVCEQKLRQLVGVFGEECEDAEQPGKRIRWLAIQR